MCCYTRWRIERSVSNPKSQAPNPNHSQLPNPKTNSQLSTLKADPSDLAVGGRIGIWSLGVGWDLELGIWDLAKSEVPDALHSTRQHEDSEIVAIAIRGTDEEA